jgi:hypothetical protein
MRVPSWQHHVRHAVEDTTPSPGDFGKDSGEGAPACEQTLTPTGCSCRQKTAILAAYPVWSRMK